MNELFSSFILITVLILLNGMFVAAEFAIIGVRATRIEQLALEGNATARRVRDIVRSPARIDRYIAMAQLGITLASLGLGMVGEPAIAHLVEPLLHDVFGLSGDIVHTISFFFALGLITYLHIVIGEMIPKSVALQNAEGTVFALAAPMLLLLTIFSIPITILNKIGLTVLRVLRVPPPAEGSRLHTADELELIISDSVVGGLIEADEQELISNIFDFSRLHVGQLMTPRPRIEAVPITISKAELLEKMFRSPRNRFPVYEQNQDQIIGIVHLKDMVHHHLEEANFDLRALLHPVPYVPEGMPADQLLAKLKKEKIHMAVVMDEYGGTAGLVTLEDLIEEVVGDVRDEFDIHEIAPIVVAAPGHIIAAGDVRLDELEAYVNIEPENEAIDVDTIGGLVIALLDDLPPPIGAEIVINNVRMRIESVEGLTIKQVSLHFTPEDNNSEM